MGKKYLTGFSSQENETRIDELPVEGRIPSWLAGSLVRTGPSKFEVGQSQYRHWFDGLAMLHKFSFTRQKIGYTCKFLESDAYLQARQKNKIVYGEFGTDPCQDLFQRFFTFFNGPKATDNGCVNITRFGNDFAATTETTKPVAFSLKDLTTAGPLDFGNDVPGQATIVHHHYDREGTLFSFLTEFGYKTKYNVFSMANNDSKKRLIASVSTGKPAYMHSIGMTKNYVILTEFPLVASSLSLRFGGKAFIENYKWKPERGMKIYLVDKNSGAVRSFETEPFFAFHHVNAFEQNGGVVFDIIAYENPSVIEQLYLHRLRSDENLNVSGCLRRFYINFSEKAVSQNIISEAPIELPRVNYARVNGRNYRYVYGAGNTLQDNFLDNVTKIDVKSGETAIWHEKDCYPGEPVFVEKPGAHSEDDGILLTIVLDAATETSFLLILNAKDLKEIGRARVPQHIPFGFHGQFIQNDDSISGI